MNIFTTLDFPQADDVWNIPKVVAAVAEGKTTDLEIERFLGMNSDGRQGRYHRKEAERFGLISNCRNQSKATERGWYFLQLSTKEEKQEFLRERLLQQRLFSYLLAYVEGVEPTQQQLRGYIIGLYPGTGCTAARRATTVLAWMRDLDIWPNNDPAKQLELTA